MIEIREVETVADFKRCHDLQKVAWNMPDIMVIPYIALLTTQKHGGLVLGAYNGQEMIGFVCGMLARWEGRFGLYSQRMGVMPAYRSQGVAYQLKAAQRQWAISQGYELIAWTYDPLEGANANLNLAKLGVVVRRYERDLYGESGAGLHAGLNSDRFWAEWHLKSRRVVERLKSPARLAPAVLLERHPVVNEVKWEAADRPRSGEPRLNLTDTPLLVEVPPDIQAMKTTDLTLARAWRMTTRLIFETYFERGYTVTDFATGFLEGQRRNFYLMEANFED